MTPGNHTDRDYLKSILEELDGIQRFLHEIASHIDKVERSTDNHAQALYYIDKKMRRFYDYIKLPYNNERNDEP